MRKYIEPTWRINSVYAIQPEELVREEIRGVIVDLDNTLIAWNQYEYTNEMRDWIDEVRAEGIQVYILSNNTQDRVSKVADPLGVPFTAGAMKPTGNGFQRAIDVLNLPLEEIAVIGDQVMTDVIGANLKGLQSILVKPIARNDNIYTQINRLLERLAFRYLGINRHGDWGDTLE